MERTSKKDFLKDLTTQVQKYINSQGRVKCPVDFPWEKLLPINLAVIKKHFKKTIKKELVEILEENLDLTIYENYQFINKSIKTIWHCDRSDKLNDLDKAFQKDYAELIEKYSHDMLKVMREDWEADIDELARAEKLDDCDFDEDITQECMDHVKKLIGDTDISIHTDDKEEHDFRSTLETNFTNALDEIIDEGSFSHIQSKYMKILYDFDRKDPSSITPWIRKIIKRQHENFKFQKEFEESKKDLEGFDKYLNGFAITYLQEAVDYTEKI